MKGKRNQRKMSSVEKSATARFILEIIGRPKEHLVQTLEEIISKINSEQGVSVSEQKIHEPTLMKDSKELFITYAEVEVKVEEPILLAVLVFKYMPANIELISPERVIFNNNQFSEILNELTRRLHSYEELARVMQIERQKMQEKMSEFVPVEKKENSEGINGNIKSKKEKKKK